MSELHPWQTDTWQALGQQLQTERLAHAYLLGGREGLGKYTLAANFARLVLCETPHGEWPCGSCRSCTLIEAGNHPDLRILQTEEDRKSIVIEQVRELIDFYALKPHYGTRKVTIIYPVELLNHNATNALLKVLEEPPSGALLLLVSHRPGQLIATLSSRCQKIVLHEPDWASCSAWLEQRRQADASLRPLSETTLFGAPLDLHEQLASTSGLSFDHVIETLAALAREHRAVLARAKEFSDVDIRRFLDTIDLVIRAAVLLRFGHQLQRLHVAAAGGEQLQEIANKLNSKRLFFFLDQIASARLAVLRSSGVRGTEVIENLFYCWANITQAEAKV